MGAWAASLLHAGRRTSTENRCRRFALSKFPLIHTCSAELKKQVLPRLTRPGTGGREEDEVEGDEEEGSAAPVAGDDDSFPFFLPPLPLPFELPLPFLGLPMVEGGGCVCVRVCVCVCRVWRGPDAVPARPKENGKLSTGQLG